MIDLTQIKKYKVQLADYDYQKDLTGRLLLAELCPFEAEVLEEILFNPSTLPIRDISRSLEVPISELDPALQKLEKLGLFTRKEDVLYIDKEARKYFETEIARFNEDFEPDLEFFRSLLKKAPIHVLPNWYTIPRSSNDIFLSLIEKYCSLPQFYERHLMEIRSEDLFGKALDLLFTQKTLSLPVEILQKALNVSPSDLEMLLISLELHFAAFVHYQKEGPHFKRVISPLKEWKSYLLHRKNARNTSSVQPETIWDRDFAFVCDLEKLASHLLNHPHPIESALSSISFLFPKSPSNYMESLIEKGLLLKILQNQESSLTTTENFPLWMRQEMEEKALLLYRHPQNQMNSSIFTERSFKEVEKSLSGLQKGVWISLEDFTTKALICLGEETKVQLKQKGKHWKYEMPSYTEEEKAFIQTVIFEKLFEAGFVTIGFLDKLPCFKITSFGNKLLSP